MHTSALGNQTTQDSEDCPCWGRRFLSGSEHQVICFPLLVSRSPSFFLALPQVFYSTQEKDWGSSCCCHHHPDPVSKCPEQVGGTDFLWEGFSVWERGQAAPMDVFGERMAPVSILFLHCLWNNQSRIWCFLSRSVYSV